MHIGPTQRSTHVIYSYILSLYSITSYSLLLRLPPSLLPPPSFPLPPSLPPSLPPPFLLLPPSLPPSLAPPFAAGMSKSFCHEHTCLYFFCLILIMYKVYRPLAKVVLSYGIASFLFLPLRLFSPSFSSPSSLPLPLPPSPSLPSPSPYLLRLRHHL